MNPIYGCSSDMGGVLSRAQGEAAAGTVVVGRRFVLTKMSPQLVSSVSLSTRGQV